MRIGIFVGAGPVPGDVLAQARTVVEAEREGFDSFWFAQVGGADVLTVIALAGPQTERIEIGTAVVPTYPRHPSVLAQQALTAQAATGGRLTLGVGPSHRPAIEALGLSYDRPARHVREYVSVLRALANEGRVELRGEVYDIAAAMRVPGATPFPILVSALAPMMLRAAGEVADGTVTWMVGLKTLESHIVPRIRAAAGAAGRPAPRVAVGLPVAVTGDAAAARAQAARDFRGYGHLENYRRVLDIEGAPDPSEIAVVGDEATVERELRAFAAAGATDLLASVFPVGDDAEASVARTRSLLRSLVGRI